MSSEISTKKIQFIDLEMLCWPDGIVPPGQSNDIIQLGLVEINVDTLDIAREKRYYIRPPNKNFEVSEYCETLTGISREQLIKQGRSFNDVMRSIVKEYAPSRKITYAWGADHFPINEHCKRYQCANPWDQIGIWDFGAIFQTSFCLKNKMTLAKALEHMGLEFLDRPHDALNDARNLARLHCATVKQLRSTCT